MVYTYSPTITRQTPKLFAILACRSALLKSLRSWKHRSLTTKYVFQSSLAAMNKLSGTTGFTEPGAEDAVLMLLSVAPGEMGG